MHFWSKERSSVSVVEVFLSLKPVFHMIATIAEKKKSSDHSDCSDNNRWDGTFSISGIVVAAIAGECFLCDRCDRWTFFFSAIAAITAIVTIMWKPGIRDRNTYTTLTDDLPLDRKCMWSLSELGIIRKWNSSHNKCVDPSWFSKATTTTMINKYKSTKRLPGCYAEFITFAVLLRKHINQGLFIRILKKEKKNSRQSWGLPYCQ